MGAVGSPRPGSSSILTSLGSLGHQVFLGPSLAAAGGMRVGALCLAEPAVRNPQNIAALEAADRQRGANHRNP